jgi:hypothetical protein
VNPSPSLASAIAATVAAAVDAGSGPGILKVYDGDMPDTTDDASTGALLATFTLPDPSAGAPTDGLATWNFTTPPSATVSAGNPTWGRLIDSDGNVVCDGTVGVSGADFNFSSIVWTTGQTVELTSGTTQGG